MSCWRLFWPVRLRMGETRSVGNSRCERYSLGPRNKAISRERSIAMASHSGANRRGYKSNILDGRSGTGLDPLANAVSWLISSICDNPMIQGRCRRSCLAIWRSALGRPRRGKRSSSRSRTWNSPTASVNLPACRKEWERMADALCSDAVEVRQEPASPRSVSVRFYGIRHFSVLRSLP